MSHNFPTLQEAIAIHGLLIAEFGGHPGTRDMGALEAALFRPQLGYYKGLIEEAAALMESLANNHPFIDGKKRVAFFVTDTFLRMNGQYIDCNNTRAYQEFMNWFETGQFRFDKLAWWLNSVVKSL